MVRQMEKKRKINPISGCLNFLERVMLILSKKEARILKILCIKYLKQDMNNLTVDSMADVIIENIKGLKRDGVGNRKVFITQFVRKKLNKRKDVVDEAIMVAILYEIDNHDNSMYVRVISRFLQGIDFQISAQKRDHTTYERVGSDMIFKRMLDTTKPLGIPVLKIELKDI
jgi:hypothetical protein